MTAKPNIPATAFELRRRAEARLGKRHRYEKSNAGTQRLLHELEVHQIELEMQNAELQKARDELEMSLEKYTDLYDFAPVGYFSIDESGVVREANLTVAALLGVERSRLINRRLLFMPPASRPIFLDFLQKVFSGNQEQACEVLFLRNGGDPFWAGVRATAAVSVKGARRWCRVAFMDITARKQAEEAQGRVATLTDANRELSQEIARRQKVEKALQKTEQHQIRLLRQSRHMQEKLRHLSHQILHAQEEERKRISRELHDEIAQILLGINVHLAALNREAAGNPSGVGPEITRTQRLVEQSVDIVHRFARELRPTELDDLGLIPALHAFMNEFTKRTGARARLTAFAAIERLDITRRTVLYRVAHEALTNVARHAQASRVEVTIEKLSDRVCMKIKDDGKSFPVKRMLRARGTNRLGLVGMKERLEMIGGDFSIESARGKGTLVRAQIPLLDRARRTGKSVGAFRRGRTP